MSVNLTVRELVALLEQYPADAVVCATLGEDVVAHVVTAADHCPPDCWDVPVDVELSPHVTAFTRADGLYVDLTVVLP
ncbi:hypothetical protein [Nocardioides sp.]|uniref:hypothetical protein n=1 Tax=Nocardioides sp. TaxID=35761 RepID=UPI002CF85D78|nr:hypothetical protein [Nocardioides sp.]HSX67050.1 hypothetical protein [Nocardioides sp.]